MTCMVWGEIANAALNTAQIVALAYIAAKFGSAARHYQEGGN